jgi:hypothetical protein
MKKLYLLLLFPLLMAATPTVVKKADQGEYTKYLAYCNKLVADTVEQLGRITYKFVVYPKADIRLGNGKVLKAGEPDYFFGNTPDTVWFAVVCRDYKAGSISTSPKPRSYYYEPKQLCIHRNKVCRIRQRRATVKDFYEWWMKK